MWLCIAPIDNVCELDRLVEHPSGCTHYNGFTEPFNLLGALPRVSKKEVCTICKNSSFVMKFKTILATKYSRLFKRSMTGTVLFIIPVLVPFLYPMTAHAGLFSFISSIFEGQEASAKVQPLIQYPNSQTIALLQATVNHDQIVEKSSDSIPVSDSQILVADISITDPIIANDSVNTQVSIYVVRDGDTLSTIAKMFDVSVNTIVWSNSDLGISRSSPLKTGQTLIILPVSGISYTVKKGDTIKGIVSIYKADLTEVLQYNDLTLTSPLAIGQTVIIPDAELQVQPPSSKTVSSGNIAHGTNGPSYSGYYIRPIVGGRKTQGLHGYNGIDLAAPIGTPIYAAAEGTVIVSAFNSGWHGGYGNFIIIAHPNGTQTVYAHLSKNIVHAGDYVKQGQNIALMGSTGNSTGSHVHFEIRGAKNPF